MTKEINPRTAQLKQMALRAQPVEAGSVSVAGFDDVKAHFQERWPEVRDRVIFHTELTIDHHLDRNDAWVRLGESRFLIAFATLTPEEAVKKTAEISEAIRRRLMGEEEAVAKHLQISQQTFSLDAAGLNDVSSNINKAQKTSRESDKTGEEGQRGRVIFKPLWDIKKQAIIEFLAKPVENLKTGAPVNGFGRADTTQERIDAISLDARTLTAVAAEIQRLNAQNTRLLVRGCIQAASFSSAAGAAKMVSTLRDLSADQRTLLTLSIYETRVGAIAFDAEAAWTSLNQLSRNTTLIVSLTEHRLDRVRAIGFESVGVDLSSENAMSEKALMAELTQFTKRAKDASLRAIIHGVPSKSLASFLVCSGVQAMSGPVIGKPAAQIDAAVRFEPGDLYS